MKKPFVLQPLNKKLLFLFFALLLFTCSALAQTKQPKTVRDFFMLLPPKYFSFDCCSSLPASRQKAEYLKRYLNVEDIANGYMSGNGDAAQEGFEMALFKRPNGSYLIGFYTYREGGIEDTPWVVFLDYKSDKWTDVSRREIPSYSPEKYEYHLPRHGTTVEVYKKVEEGDPPKLYDLVWKDGKFTNKK
jgi:hypothetical protein